MRGAKQGRTNQREPSPGHNAHNTAQPPASIKTLRWKWRRLISIM